MCTREVSRDDIGQEDRVIDDAEVGALFWLCLYEEVIKEEEVYSCPRFSILNGHEFTRVDEVSVGCCNLEGMNVFGE